MPRLSTIVDNAEHTWGEQMDKAMLAGTPFWIHGARASEYEGDDERMVRLIILNIADQSGKQRNTITLGRNEERETILAYFSEGNSDPLGPCMVHEVPLKGGRTFWRLEDAED